MQLWFSIEKKICKEAFVNLSSGEGFGNFSVRRKAIE